MAEESKMSAEQVLKALLEKETEHKGKFQADVAYLYESIQKGTYSKRDYLCTVLSDYMEQVEPEGNDAPALGKNVSAKEKDGEAVFLMLNQVLSLENASLGKWPGKSDLGLWQQVDANLAIGKGTGDLFEEVGRVIAANGKKDADKEAVFREILANSIVERASLLAEYDKPDNAFESFDFYHGEEKNHAYAEFPAKWHRIRNDRLSETSVILTAATDAPVRSLSKELEQDKTFGVLAASVSDDSQRKDLYDKVIAPMVKAYREDDPAKERLPKYAKAREEFLAQKKVVEGMQASLGKLQKDFLRNWKEEKMRTKDLKAAEATIEHAKKDAETAEQTRKTLMEKRNKANDDMNELMEKISEVGAAAQAAKNEWNRCNDIVRTGFDKEQELRASVNAMTKLINKKKYDQVMEEADKIQQEAIEAQEKAPAADKKLKELTAEYDELMVVKNKIQQELEDANDKVSQISKTVNDARTVITRKEEEAEQLRHALDSVKKEREVLLDAWSKEQGDDRRILLDEQFAKDLISEDGKIREKREAENPWFSKNYQKEREKLFTLAVTLQKAFVEASGCCMANLATLTQYWGLWKKGNDKITFHQADLDETVPTLWRTLSLLLPVTEITLPAVAEVYADAKKPGLYGTIVIDAEGKLPAVKVLGALYRGRSAIVFP